MLEPIWLRIVYLIGCCSVVFTSASEAGFVIHGCCALGDGFCNALDDPTGEFTIVN